MSWLIVDETDRPWPGTPTEQFTQVLRSLYAVAYKHQLITPLPRPPMRVLVHVAQVRGWPVAARRMLLRLLLGLGATGTAAEALLGPYYGAFYPVRTPVGPSRGIQPHKLGAKGLAGAEARGIRPDPQKTPQGPPGDPPGLLTGLPANPPGLGAWVPGRVGLLVGDRPGPGWRSRTLTWPFISALRTGCSSWLAETLEEAGIGEHQLYWVNGFTKEGAAIDAAFVHVLQPAVTIALGNSAARWCKALLVEHEEVHHPQFWKRFHSRQRYHLTTILKRRLPNEEGILAGQD